MGARLHPAAVAATSAAARRGRAPHDRLAARHPGLAGRLMRAAFAVRDLRLRRLLLIEAYRRGYEAFNREDWELNTLGLHPTEYVFRAAEPVTRLPDMRAEYRGIDGYLEVQRLLKRGFADVRYVLQSIHPIPGDRVLVAGAFHGLGAGSGARFRQPISELHVFRDGRVVEQIYWWGAKDAFEAAGVPAP